MRGKIEPFYFGAPEEQLLGCHHAPQASPARDCAVVLCYPAGGEYIFSHRAYQQLAVRLSEVGFNVLRFDFYGCGDSAGDCVQWRIHRWLADIASAVREIRGRCGLDRVCLVGVRLGGSLSLLAGAGYCDIESIVLWDPIVSGRAYLEELTRRDSGMRPNLPIVGEEYVEISGFVFHNPILLDLAEIDLLSVRRKPAAEVLIVESEEGIRGRELKEHLERLGVAVEHKHLPAPKIWEEHADPILNVIGLRRIPQAVVSWLSRAYS